MNHDTNRTQHETNNQSEPNYKLRRGVAILALGTIFAGGIAHEIASKSEDPEAVNIHLAGEKTAEIPIGGTVNDIAINLGTTLNNDQTLSLAQQESITQQSKDSYTDIGVAQPGYEVTVQLGELDGKLDSNGDEGTDLKVTVTPDIIK